MKTKNQNRTETVTMQNRKQKMMRHRARLAYRRLFKSHSAAIDFEEQVLSRDDLPPCAKAVRRGGPETDVYWSWLASQVGK